MVGLLARIRSAFREGWHEPVTHYGAVYEGSYELKDSRVIGAVRHMRQVSDRPPVSVIVLRDKSEIASTSAFQARGQDWRFEVELGSTIQPDDVLRDRLSVFALDRVGAKTLLQLSGASQLAYVREVFGQQAVTELTIDFAKDGNSRGYAKEGWYAPEPDHTWTSGTISIMEIPLQAPGSTYRCEIIAWPFLVPGTIEAQTSVLSIDGSTVAKFFVRRGQNYLEAELPVEHTQKSPITLRFDHPDAARPSALSESRDGRVLAIAFKRLIVRRLLERQ